MISLRSAAFLQQINSPKLFENDKLKSLSWIEVNLPKAAPRCASKAHLILRMSV